MTFEPNSTRPVNPLPPVVVALAALIAIVELIFLATSSGFVGGADAAGLRLTMIEDYGFYEPLLAWMVENQTVRLKYLMRFVTYPFLQGSFTQAVFVIVFVLALGKMVAERMGQWKVLAIFLGASIIGALVYGIVWDTRVPLYGGYPGAYALVGAFTLVLYTQLGETGGRQIQAFALIGALLAIQFVFGFFFGAGTGWVAEIAGFVSGFFLAALLFPGSWDRIVARLRQRG
ncbi:rhomboid family intramembrane serine protease [Maritimibacter sp. UBA3975]|uniref:rhomboid family intramembrane serine protease n=1 Tax=Maritimibacter sp. UBA3975 TaxID=1946833 RepID=UPI000C0B36A9|nr:rhomboid family intramembrane serine protease [Maritimibacter sp. UBA3975]MAM62740.1 rhomboid family intramembrane serine protease [Maritimibacter sp.]|tara:strand:+ start:1060 stop:1752 length:693 start_codon:yes stop_codon:yes gene_type:complete